MSEVIVASTTDSQSEVNAAAGGKPQDETIPDAKPAPTGHPEVENDPEAPPVEAAEPEKPAEEKAPKALSKKFDKLYREKKELEERLLALEAKAAPKVEEKPVVPTEVAAKFDTFDSWSEKQLAAGKTASLDDFLEQRDAWKEARDAQKAEQDAIKQQATEVANAYNEKVEAFKAEHEDWDEVVGQPIDLPAGVGPAILELDNGPEVAYFLGKNPKSVKELNALSPYAAIAFIGRLSAKLEKPAPEETPTNNVTTRNPDRSPIVSKAPTPITPLKGGGVRPSKDLSDPNISYDDYRKLREEQAKTRFRR